MSVTIGDLDNADEAAAQFESTVSRIEQRRRQRAANADTRAWLEGRLQEETQTADLYDREFEFEPIGTAKVADVLELIGDGEDLSLSEMPTLLRIVCDILGKHCTDPAMDADAWGRVPPDETERVFEEVAMSDDADLDQEELAQIEEFRNE